MSVSLFLCIKRGLKTWVERVFFMFCFTAIAFFILGLGGHPEWLDVTLRTICAGIPGWFWLACCVLYEEDFQVEAWHLLVVLITMLSPPIHFLFQIQGQFAELILEKALSLLDYTLVGIALYLTVKSWREDLIEERRRIRAISIAFLGIFIFAVLGGQESLLNSNWWLEVGKYMIAAVVAMVFNLQLSSFNLDNLFFTQNDRAEELKSEEDENEDELELKKLMQTGVYRETGLTIGGLAELMDYKEHNLRRLINKKLGYRNFSTFLNGYRLREAADRLKTEETPIISIAHEVGFGSLTSFNSAFKNRFKLTPSQYKKQEQSYIE